MATSKKKAAAKKTPAKQTTAKQTPAKQTPAKKTPAKKTAAKQTPALEPGSAAPSFELPGDDGETYSKAALAGQRFVLYFYPRDNTPGCTTEAQEFSALREDFEELGVTVLGVSTDTLASHAKFRAKHDLSIVLLSDTEREVASAYGAWGEKMMYGKPVVGMIRSTFVVGPDGKLEAVYKVRKAAGHAQQVLEDLRARLDE